MSEFWSVDSDAEDLLHTDVDDAVEEWLDYNCDVAIEDLPRTVKVFGFQRMTPSPGGMLAQRVLDLVLDDLSEELGSPYGDPPEVTQEMREAADAFVKLVADQYEPWACELSGEEVEVDVMAWTKEHHPDWLEPASEAGSDASDAPAE